MAGVTEAAEPDKTPERVLAEAAKRIKKLAARVADQQETFRGLRSGSRKDDNLAEQISELKSEISDQEDEI
jgi:hypothetical protein